MADWSNDADWSNETDWSSIGGAAADESGLLAFFASLLTLIVVLVWRRN